MPKKEDLPKEKKCCEKLKKFYIVFKGVVKRKSRVLVVLSLFIILTSLVFYFVLPQSLTSKDMVARDEKAPIDVVKEVDRKVPSEETAFENLSKAREDILKELKNVDDEGVYYWTDWNWEEDLIYAHVKEVNKLYGEMKVVVNPPERATFARREILVTVKCSKGSTISVADYYVTDEPREVLDKGFDVFDKAKPEDILVTYCLDQDCINVGGECALITRGDDYEPVTRDFEESVLVGDDTTETLEQDF